MVVFIFSPVLWAGLSFLYRRVLFSRTTLRSFVLCRTTEKACPSLRSTSRRHGDVSAIRYTRNAIRISHSERSRGIYLKNPTLSHFGVPCSIPVLSMVEGFDIHYCHCEACKAGRSNLVFSYRHLPDIWQPKILKNLSC